MPEYLRLEDSGWRRLTANLRQIARQAEIKVPREVGAFVRLRGQEAIENVYYSQPTGERSHPAYTTGEWLRGLRIFVQPQLGAVTFRNDSQQAIWTENGRQPGYAPIRRLAQWAADKFDLDPDDAYAVGKAIARQVTLNGVTPQRIMFNALDPSTPEGADFHDDWKREIQVTIDELMTQYGFMRQG